jgi:predicted transcriptional regulator
MPVDFEQYSPEDGRIDLAEGTNARRLLSFLLNHQGVGFTPAELHDQTDIPRGSISPTLARLERAGLVRHKGDYWAAEDDDRIAAASAAVLGLTSVTDASSNDWYGENPGWSDELSDLSDDEE